MLIKVQKELLTRAVLESENIFITDENRATRQDIRPLGVLVLNLMSIKEGTETQLLWALSSTFLQVDCTFFMLSTHVSKNTSASHLNKSYVTFDDIGERRYDGMIITRAPAENLEFEEVDHWSELSKIMKWSETHVASIIHIYWRAQAGLYHHYGIHKYPIKRGLSGIYNHKVLNRKVSLVRSLNNYFLVSHSRYMEVYKNDILKHPKFMVLAESEGAGVFLVTSCGGSRASVQDHPEYDRMTLNNEYHRDLNKGLDPELPYSYYEHNDPFSTPALTWRNTSNALYTSWLNYCAYQTIPYMLDEGERKLYLP